jgi:hypothetical protein
VRVEGKLQIRVHAAGVPQMRLVVVMKSSGVKVFILPLVFEVITRVQLKQRQDHEFFCISLIAGTLQVILMGFSAA